MKITKTQKEIIKFLLCLLGIPYGIMVAHVIIQVIEKIGG